MYSVVKILSCATHMFPVEVEQGNILPSCLSFPTINKCLFSSLLSDTFFFGIFVSLILSFTMAPFRVPKLKKAGMHPMVKLCVR